MKLNRKSPSVHRKEFSIAPSKPCSFSPRTAAISTEMRSLRNIASKLEKLYPVQNCHRLEPNLLGLSASKASRTAATNYGLSGYASASVDANANPTPKMENKALKISFPFAMPFGHSKKRSASRQLGVVNSETTDPSSSTLKPTTKPSSEEQDDEFDSYEVEEAEEENLEEYETKGEKSGESHSTEPTSTKPETADSDDEVEEDPIAALEEVAQDIRGDAADPEEANVDFETMIEEPAEIDLEEEEDEEESETVSIGTVRRKSKRKKRWPFGRVPVTPDESLEDEEEDMDERPDETPAQRAWRRQNVRLFKFIKPNMKEPEYLQGGAELSFEDTRATELRKEYLEKVKIRLDAEEAEFQNDAALQFIEPKMNRSYVLRMKHQKKEAIVTQYFNQYYDKYKKPPFKSNYKKNKC